MKKYLSIAYVIFITFIVLFSAQQTEAATILSEDFGTGSTVVSVPGWSDGGLIGDDSEVRVIGSGNDTSSPDGGRFAVIYGPSGYICKTISTVGYDNVELSYQWRGDGDSGSASDDAKVEFKPSVGANCSDPSGWTNLTDHDMRDDSSWSTQSPVSDVDLDNTSFLIRFRNETSGPTSGIEHFRVDGVLITGDVIVDTTGPEIEEIIPVGTTNDTTPNYTFTTNEDGTITYGGSCSSVTTSASVGSNTVTFNELAEGTYSDCTITVTDTAPAQNVSNTLEVSEFTIDLTAPEIEAPDTQIFEATGLTTNPVLVLATATDEVDSNPTVTHDPSTDFSLGTTTVTWTATDDAGNSVSTTSEVVIVDTTAPTLVLNDNPLELWVNEDYEEPGFTATDLVDGDVTGGVEEIENDFDNANVGTYHIKYRVSDEQGNETEETRTIRVIDRDRPIIHRIGGSPVTAEAGSLYVDLGATAVDQNGDDLTSAIVTVNSVNTAILGEYTVTYDVMGFASTSATQAKRIVNVVDTTAPVITRIGDEVVEVVQNTSYTDQGATATDNLDGDITANIETDNPVNTGEIGEYTVTYNVSDSQGHPAIQVTRTVKVVPPPPPQVKITVHKITSYPDNFDKEFTFVVKNSEGEIVDTKTANANGGEGAVDAVFELDPGVYTVEEQATSLWELDTESTYCEYDGEGYGEQSEENPTEVYLLEDGDEADCTFTNRVVSGEIRVVKNVLAQDGDTEVEDAHIFSVSLFEYDGESTSTLVSTLSFGEGQDAVFTGLDLKGKYTITENTDADYELVSITPDDEEDESGAQIDIEVGTTTVVNIVNKQKQTVVVEEEARTTSGGRRRNTGSVLGVTTDDTAGQVLGANSCPSAIGSYLKFGWANDVEDVKKLQAFLNETIDAGLPITGFFGPLTRSAVEKFQAKYSEQTLAPWVKAGFPEAATASGYVYKTTLAWINALLCGTDKTFTPPMLP